MKIEVAFDAAYVPAMHAEAIDRIMRRAAQEVLGKVALLAVPNVVEVQATEWDGSQDVPMRLPDAPA